MTIPGAFEESQYAAVADGRYLIRRAFRIIDQEARKMGVDPLAFQALVQLAGVGTATRSVTDLAVRLDIPRGLASRLATDLEGLALVDRLRSPDDKRVTLVRATSAGLDMVDHVFVRCLRSLTALQDEMPYEKRAAVLRNWARNFAITDVIMPPEGIPTAPTPSL
jgi:DNA-binding MarR family transcriptional regulator